MVVELPFGQSHRQTISEHKNNPESTEIPSFFLQKLLLSRG